MADATEKDMHTNAVVLSVLIAVVVIFIVAVIAYSAQRPLRRACALQRLGPQARRVVPNEHDIVSDCLPSELADFMADWTAPTAPTAPTAQMPVRSR